MTVGLMNIVTTADSGKIIADEGPALGKILGWKVVSAETGGDPSKNGPTTESLLNQGAEAIVSVANEPSAMTSVMEGLEEKGIPFINIASGVAEAPGLTANYVENKTVSEKILEEIMAENLPKGSTIGALYTPLLPAGVEQFHYLEDHLAEHGWEMAQAVPNDLANLIPGAEQATNAILTGHPDLSALWGDTVYSGVFQQAVKRLGKCGEIQVYGHSAGPEEVQGIREGCITALANYPVRSDVWLAFDQLLRWKARELSVSEIPATNEELYAEQYGGFEPDAPAAVTEENVVSSGRQPPKSDWQTFYLKKWQLEYGVEGNPVDLEYGTPAKK